MLYPTDPLPEHHSFPDAEAFAAFKKRLYATTQCASLYELAAFLETKPSQITDASRRLRCPVTWVQVVFIKTYTNPIWLLEGEGEQYL